MSDFSIEVTLEALVCRDTESIHSSDKFALAGAVFTDTDSAGIVLPMMRINDGETRPLRTLVFNGTSPPTGTCSPSSTSSTAAWAPGKAQGLLHPWDASRIAAVEVRGYLGRGCSGLR